MTAEPAAQGTTPKVTIRPEKKHSAMQAAKPKMKNKPLTIINTSEKQLDRKKRTITFF